MRKVATVVVFLLLFSAEFCFANRDTFEYSKYLNVDLDQPLPKYNELKEKYFAVDSPYYDRKYDTHVAIGNMFNETFRTVINSYGSSNKRLKSEDEEELIALLELMPKDMYQYFGPMLHVTPNMSEKILNMPGIKETKNKFPTRIAPQLSHIEDLEFLSPYLYYALIPELWPENRVDADEPAKKKVSVPKIEYDPSYMEKLKEFVPESDYFPEGKGEKYNLQSNIRTFRPDKNSPLTSADVKAFARTLSKVKEFGEKKDYAVRIFTSGNMLDTYEIDQGSPIKMTGIKDVLNPCQRLVQKVRIAGFDKELQIVIGEEGFDLNGWAYTCDKTIKAYRLSMISTPMLKSLNEYKAELYNDLISDVARTYTGELYATIQAMIEMYSAPMSDVLEVRKNRTELAKEFKDLNYYLIGEPLALYY